MIMSLQNILKNNDVIADGQCKQLKEHMLRRPVEACLESCKLRPAYPPPGKPRYTDRGYISIGARPKDSLGQGKVLQPKMQTG